MRSSPAGREIMKSRWIAIILFWALTTGLALAGRGSGAPHGSGGSHGHGGFHGHRNVIIGGPVFWPWYYYPYYFYPPYYPPYYYYPPYGVPYLPPTYIEQGSDEMPAQQPVPSPAYWYYCPSVKAYYPYVMECPEGWQRVAPQPPPPNQ